MSWSVGPWNNSSIFGWSNLKPWNNVRASGFARRSDMHLSLINGTAFIDITGVDLSPYIGSQITILDSGKRQLVGFLKASGTGETLGGNQVSNGADWTGGPPPTSWTPSQCTLAAIAGGQAGNCLEMTRTGSTLQSAFQTCAGLTDGWLIQVGVYVMSGTAGNGAYLIRIGSGGYITASGTTTGAWVQNLFYGTVDTSKTSPRNISLDKNSATAGTMLFDTATIFQVTAPSAKGATIVSTSGGSTRNWTIPTGFVRNDSAGYIYLIS